MNVWSLYPVAVGADGDGTDVMLIVGWQSFTNYGQWWDAYPSSDVTQMERETMTCHGSALWESEDLIPAQSTSGAASGRPFSL